MKATRVSSDGGLKGDMDLLANSESHTTESSVFSGCGEVWGRGWVRGFFVPMDFWDWSTHVRIFVGGYTSSVIPTTIIMDTEPHRG